MRKLYFIFGVIIGGFLAINFEEFALVVNKKLIILLSLLNNL